MGERPILLAAFPNSWLHNRTMPLFSSFLALGHQTSITPCFLSENSNKLFNDIVNLTNTNLIFFPFYDSRKSCWIFSGTISTEPAASLSQNLARNQDAIADSFHARPWKLCSLFGAAPPRAFSTKSPLDIFPKIRYHKIIHYSIYLRKRGFYELFHGNLCKRFWKQRFSTLSPKSGSLITAENKWTAKPLRPILWLPAGRSGDISGTKCRDFAFIRPQRYTKRILLTRANISLPFASSAEKDEGAGLSWHRIRWRLRR